MEYQAITSVWEITMGCNMRCEHCGSSCAGKLDGELNTDEALALCDQLGQLGLEWITLSGGEPTLRKDWPLIARRLRENNIIPNLLTNGWLLNNDLLNKVEESGISTTAISLDGLQETHDSIRQQGSFARIMTAYDLMKERDIYSAAITTVSKKNIAELTELKELLIDKGVNRWQLQFMLPMGNATNNQDWLIDPKQVDEIIDFAYEVMKEGKITIDLADCLGYYNFKSIKVNRSKVSDSDLWQGCPGGKNSFGILHNGDITACTSLRNKEFIVGNIRNESLLDLWTNTDNFSWNRELKKDDLAGLCKVCSYGDICLGGCSNTRFTMEDSVYAENRYCSYNVAMQPVKEKASQVKNIDRLVLVAKKSIEKKDFQVAEILISRALELEADNRQLLDLYGHIHFKLKNYQKAKEINERVLQKFPEHVYAIKGLGLSLTRLGQLEEGINLLRKAVKLTDESFMDPYYDLAVVLQENDREEEALEVLKEGRKRSDDFVVKSKVLYQELITKAV